MHNFRKTPNLEKNLSLVPKTRFCCFRKKKKFEKLLSKYCEIVEKIILKNFLQITPKWMPNKRYYIYY
jgi:hypothetical protein